MFKLIAEIGFESRRGHQLTPCASATVRKQIAGMERYLGAQLLMRTSHAVKLTDAGRDFVDSSSRLLEELEAAESRIGRGLQAPSGRVRVSVAPSFAALYLVPRLQEFFPRFPAVSIEA